jgi:antitoxin (DNA-binding transcriptional repressor) of toxin-antitoxin stability system
MNVAEAERNFSELVEKVHREGVTIDLEKDNKVIARLTPPLPPPPKLTLGEFFARMQTHPCLGDDAENFAKDLREIRAEAGVEADPWE